MNVQAHNQLLDPEEDGGSKSFWDDATDYLNTGLDVVTTGASIVDRFSGSGSSGSNGNTGVAPPTSVQNYSQTQSGNTAPPGAGSGGSDDDGPNYWLWGAGGVAAAAGVWYVMSRSKTKRRKRKS